MTYTKPFSLFKNILFILFLIYICGCTEGYVYQEEKVLDSEVWTYQENMAFELQAPDTSYWYDLELDVRHAPSFSFQNLYLEVETGFPSDTSFTDLINLDLAMTSGQWLGKCNSKNCSIPFLLKKRFKFEEPGVYSFKFRQASRLDSLADIHSFQLSLRKAKEAS